MAGQAGPLLLLLIITLPVVIGKLRYDEVASNAMLIQYLARKVSEFAEGGWTKPPGWVEVVVSQDHLKE